MLKSLKQILINLCNFLLIRGISYNYMKYVRILFAVFMSLWCCHCYSYDLKVDGICYNVISESDKTLEVTWEALNTRYVGNITIPNNVNYNGSSYKVIGIGKCSFVYVKGIDEKGECNNWYTNNDLKSVILSSNILYIDDYSFASCGQLTKVIFSQKLSTIGQRVFEGCYSITSMNFSDTQLTNIGYSAFNHCYALEMVSFPKTLNFIDKYSFDSTNLKSVSIDAANQFYTVKDNVIFNKEFTELCFYPPGKDGFYNIPDGITKISSTAFFHCIYLTGIEMPSSISSIGIDAFAYCRKIEEINFPSQIREIQYGAFRDCSLKKIVIPESLSIIGSEAFSCETIDSIVSYIKNPYSIDKYTFGSTLYDKVNVLVPVGCATKYKATEGWNLFKNITEITQPQMFSISINVTGNGSAFYDGTTIRSKTSTFTVNEGTNATISFSADNGYRIKSVKVNSTNVTSSVSNNQYTVSNIKANTTVEVEFEAIPPTTYTLSISSTGSGYASYDGNTIRSKTTTFTVNKGTNATISFSADHGYRIKSVKVNNSDISSSVSDNQYTVSNIKSNTTVEVEFEAIPQTYYKLSITAKGSGFVSYREETIRNGSNSYSVPQNAAVQIYFNPDNGYRVKSATVNGSDITSIVNGTSPISYNLYSFGMFSDISIEAEFEAIPVTTYTLSIKATGNGSVSYDGNTIRSKTGTFTVNEGTSATISFSPDNGYRVKSVKVNSSDVTSNLSNNKYSISNINKNTNVEVEFQEELKTFTSDGLNYAVLSYDDKTVNLANGKYGTVLEVPATITYQDITWKVAGIDNAALANNEELAAIIWNPLAAFTVSVSNPNLLLYVKSANYAPATIQNVVVNSTAESIVLTDAASGNNFYCPKEFTAKKISYTHNYGMITGLGESRGWETIALPFDVKKIAHSSKGELTPFANWRSGDSKKPFWLMSYGASGWANASSIKANTPYIISMPNNPDYKAEFRLSGNITFSAENVTVKKSDNLQTGNYGGNTFTPNFFNTDNSGYLALNVNNDYVSYSGGSAEGSTFVVNLRLVHPFEAYMTSTSKTRSTISINGDMATGIEDMSVLIDESKGLRIYNLKGQLIKVEQDKSLEEVRRSLPAGVYIVNGKKLIIK